jgi:hypothetical protein
MSPQDAGGAAFFGYFLITRFPRVRKDLLRRSCTYKICLSDGGGLAAAPSNLKELLTAPVIQASIERLVSTTNKPP